MPPPLPHTHTHTHTHRLVCLQHEVRWHQLLGTGRQLRRPLKSLVRDLDLLLHFVECFQRQIHFHGSIAPHAIVRTPGGQRGGPACGHTEPGLTGTLSVCPALSHSVQGFAKTPGCSPPVCRKGLIINFYNNPETDICEPRAPTLFSNIQPLNHGFSWVSITV